MLAYSYTYDDHRDITFLCVPSTNHAQVSAKKRKNLEQLTQIMQYKLSMMQEK